MRQRRKEAKTPTHGTNAGFQWHIRHNLPPCDPCRAAHAEYMRQYRKTSSGAAVTRREAKIRSGAISELIGRHSNEFRELLNQWREATRP